MAITQIKNNQILPGTITGTEIAAGSITADKLETNITFTGTSTLLSGTTIGNLTFTDGNIIDSSGAIAFGNENLSTSGSITGGSVVVDNITIDLNTISTTVGALNITPFAGSAIVLDGTISIDAGVVTGATSITSTGFIGALTGNASTATNVAASGITGTTLAAGVTGSSLTSVGTITSGTWSGSFGAVSGASLTSLTAANISAGTITATLSGNASTATNVAASGITGTTLAAGVTGSSLTSVGTLTALQVDNVNINGNTIITSSGNLDITPNGASIVNITTGLTVGGDLIVNGTTTTVSTTNTVITDALLELGNGTTGTPTSDAGIVVERGLSSNIFWGWDEATDEFTVGTGTFTGITAGNLTTTDANMRAATITASTNFVGPLTGNASTATSAAGWTTGRTITLSGDVSGTSPAWDGTGNLAFINTVVANDSHTHNMANLTGTVYTAGSGASLTSLTAANISAGSLANGVNLHYDATNTANAYKISFTGTTGDAAAAQDSLIDAGTGVFTYNPSTNTLSVPGLKIGTGALTTNTIIDVGSNTSSILLPIGANANRPATPTAGMIRYNTDQTAMEVYDGGWTPLVGTAPASISAGDSSVSISDPGTGAINMTVDAEVVANFDVNGLDLLTGNDYSINDVSVLNATTLGTNVTGSSLTSVGTITSGTWQGTTVAVNQGGTGTTTATGSAGSVVLSISPALTGTPTAPTAVTTTNTTQIATTAFVQQELGTLSANSLTQGDTTVVLTDTGADGAITFKTDNALGLTITGGASPASTFAGTVAATSFSGSGASLTSLTAANISAGTITATLSGNASTATNVAAAGVQGGNLGSGVKPYFTASAGAAAYKIPFLNNTGNASVNTNMLLDSGVGEFTYNPSTNTLTATNITGTASSAKYADLAENYVADKLYEPGTVLAFGGTYEVQQSATDNDRKIAGIVSSAPAYLMNSAQEGEFVVPVGLQGRVYCKVTGIIQKGDMLVSDGNGAARAESNPVMGSVIGKALENFTGQNGIIEVVVGRV